MQQVVTTEVIEGLEPDCIWRHFQHLSRLPRPSGQEQGVIDWLKELAAEHELFFEQDEIGNVLIRKPASSGCEYFPTIILQSHLDMVCQKRPDVVHNFSADALKLVIDGEWLRASGTTLGADNGIGVAAMIAVLTSDNITHGPLECLFTVDEEAGLNGAAGLRKNWLQGEILLNLDSEDEGELYIGCAGGQDINVTMTLPDESVNEHCLAMQLAIGGLRGGHSGVDIHRGRGNAISLLALLLAELRRDFAIGIADFSGGSVRNAIPRDAQAIIVFEADKQLAIEQRLQTMQTQMFKSWQGAEPNIAVSYQPVDKPTRVFSSSVMDAVLSAIKRMPHGVIAMLDDMPLVVETSCNLGALAIRNNQLKIAALARSSFEDKKRAVANEARRVFEQAGCAVESSGGYPGWAPDTNSPLLNKLLAVYQQTFDRIPEVKVIHAGLECGLLGAKYPDWQMISFGPTIRYPHSPEEKVHIPSVERFWLYLRRVLSGLAT